MNTNIVSATAEDRPATWILFSGLGSLVLAGFVLGLALNWVYSSWPQHEPLIVLVGSLTFLSGSLYAFWMQLRKLTRTVADSGEEVTQTDFDAAAVPEYVVEGSEISRSLSTVKLAVLFLDDEKFHVPGDLVERGFEARQVYAVSSMGDIGNIADDLVFCDIGGIADGMFPKLQGAGVIQELRRMKLPPFVVAYTSTKPEIGSSIAKIIYEADGQVSKLSAAADEYLATIVKFTEELARTGIQKVFQALDMEVGNRHRFTSAELVAARESLLKVQDRWDSGSVVRAERILCRAFLACRRLDA